MAELRVLVTGGRDRLDEGGDGTANCRRLALNAHITVIDIPEAPRG